MNGDPAKYVERSIDVLDSSSQMTESDIEMKFIQPLLDLLGWDRFTDVQTQYALPAGTTRIKVDYALFIEDEIEAIIEVKSSHELTESDRDQLRSYMRQAETDWGLVTNGRSFQILSLTDRSSSTEGVLVEIPIEEVDSEWGKMRILSKEMVRSGESHEIKEKLDTKEQGIERLEKNSKNIKKEITNYLIEETNDSLLPEFENEVESFVDSLIQNLNKDPSSNEIPRTPDAVLEILGTRLPGRTNEVRHERAKFILTGYDFLQREEKTTSDEIKDFVAEEHRNTLSEDDIDRHWRNYLRENLAELPRVEPPPRGASRIWRYITPELDEEIRVNEIDDWILELENIPTGTSESIERQQAIIQQSYDYVKEKGRATKEEINTILPDYTAHYQDFRGFWSYCLQEAFKECDEIEAPVAGHQDWRYIGEEEMPPELDIAIDDWVKNLDVPGEKMTKKEREALLQYSYNFLQEVGEAQRGDFEEHLSNNIPSQTGRYNRFQGLWSYLLKDGLEAAPDVQTYSSGKVNPTTYVYSPS